MAILDNEPRSANALAAGRPTVFRIDHEALREDDNLLSLKISRQIAVILAKKVGAFNYR